MNIKKIYFLFTLIILSILIYFLPNILRAGRKSLVKNSNNDPKIKVIRDLINSNNCDFDFIEEIPQNSSVVIGHLYGSPYNHDGFIDVKAKNFLLKNKFKIKNLFITGDVFSVPDKKKWTKLYELLGDEIRILIAPGNHDIGNIINKEIFIKSAKQNTNFPFIHKEGESTYIIEDTVSSNWLIDKKVFSILEKVEKGDYLYLMRHNIGLKELLPISNSNSGMKYELPSFKELSNLIKKDIIIFAGDGGAFSYLPRFFCRKYGNLTYIVNGLGGVKDDLVIVIYKNKVYKYLLN